MSHNPMAAAGRRYRKTLKLGTDARCIGCGLSNPTQLIAKRRSLLEGHHVLGVQHAPDVVAPVCLNCHALFSAGQVDDGVPLQWQSTLPERIRAILLALASFLRVLVAFLCGQAERISGFVAGLDSTSTDWRGAPWAR